MNAKVSVFVICVEAIIYLLLYNLHECNFNNKRRQRVVLNGPSSTWKLVKACVPQVSVLESVFYLICINDLPKGLISDAKFFADETSLFLIVNCVKACFSS